MFEKPTTIETPRNAPEEVAPEAPETKTTGQTAERKNVYFDYLKKEARAQRGIIDGILAQIDLLKDSTESKYLEIMVEKLKLKEAEEKFEKLIAELPENSQF